MTFQDFIRGVFGLKRNGNDQNFPHNPGDDGSNKFRNPIWQNDGDADDEDLDDQFRTYVHSCHFETAPATDFRRGPSTGFHVFTNPLEIHRYFEQQLNEFMRGFQQGPFGNDSFFEGMNPSVDSFFGSLGDAVDGSSQFALPSPESEDQPPNGKNLRELYLKPQYESPKSGPDMFKDSDLDGKIDPKDIGEILSRSPGYSKPDSSYSKSNFNWDILGFGKSTTSKTIRRSDGTMEMHKTVKDSQGNEETTTTYQRGDQSYTVTISRDASGEEKRVENFSNIDEDKMPEFRSLFDRSRPMLPLPEHQPRDERGPPAGASDDPSYWFNKFFKN